MSEVKRYLINWHMEEEFEHPQGRFVMASDFDAERKDCIELRDALKSTMDREDAAQSELAALREELAEIKHSRDYCNRVAIHNKELGDDLQQRLADAERRNAATEANANRYIGIRDVIPLGELSEITGELQTGAEWDDAIDAALTKPEEAKS